MQPLLTQLQRRICLLALLTMLAAGSLLAQAPEGFKFQAVARDADNNPLSSQNIAVRINLLRNGANGPTDYSERHEVMTSDLGVFDLQIGRGLLPTSDFSAINWGASSYFLNVEMDPDGGTNYVDLGASQLLSVPYALFARESGDGGGGTDDQTLSLSGTTLQIEDGNSVNLSSLQDGTEDADANPNNELQTLSLSGNNLSLSRGGGSVNLSGIGGNSLWTAGGSNIYRNTGNVGIGTSNPEMRLNVNGDVLINSNQGALHIGYPNNGNRWRMSTTNAGADLLFRSRVANSSAFNTRFAFRQGGEFQVGTSGSPEAWAHVLGNSTIAKPQMKLEESGNDYARLELGNTQSSNFWHVAGYPASSAANARLNLFYGSRSGGIDFMTVTGDGDVGIYGTPTARLEIFQRSQNVGTGLRFDDGTANQDWDVTHGFALRFHYGGSLRGFINASTGAYTQSSDESLKTAVAGISPVLDKLRALRVKTYRYKAADKPETTIGLLAQEAKELFPELVSYSEADQLYGVNYAGFSMVAIKAIQEQQATIDAQGQKIKDLEARLARIEALLNAVKDE